MDCIYSRFDREPNALINFDKMALKSHFCGWEVSGMIFRNLQGGTTKASHIHYQPAGFVTYGISYESFYEATHCLRKRSKVISESTCDPAVSRLQGIQFFVIYTNITIHI